VDAVDDADDAWSGPYLDPASDANDRIYTRRGGFLRELAEVDPLSFNVLPNTAEGGDPDHLIALKHAAAALLDAGYGPQGRKHRPERSGVVIGRGTYGNRGLASVLARGLFLDQAMDIARALRPDLDEDRLHALREHFRGQLPLYNADMVGPLTPNVIAGLIANRLDLMGPSFIVDAACASTLIALNGALRELDSGRCDLMLVGGVHSHTPPQLFIQFCQIKALSRDRIRPFQQGSEGTLLGEGVGMLALKRREDAEADGDRIYALIRGIGTSSDGRAKGLLAPRREGQVEALRAAYAGSGIDPATIGLIEAHGTGTAIGDLTEIQTLQEVFGKLGAGPRIALGSVKSMIGHCLPAAGSASLIKTALALHQCVLPATLCDAPDPALGLETTPFYINNRSRPWIHGEATPRRAAVNAFGFGGANAHVILEEYRPPQKRVQVRVLDAPTDGELLLFGADSPAALSVAVRAALAHLRAQQPPDLGDLAGACAKAAAGDHRLAVIANSNAEATKRLEQALERLDGSPRPFRTRAGLYYGHGPAPGKLCFLFPGEGSQYPDMLDALTRQYAPLREWFDFIEQGARARGDASRAEALFPPPTGLSDRDRTELEQRLFSMEPAAESLFAPGSACTPCSANSACAPTACSATAPARTPPSSPAACCAAPAPMSSPDICVR
jgi:Polyketide synthase modules and related proteins